MASLYQQRVNKLVGWGLTMLEAKELTKHYKTGKNGERYLIGYTIGEMRSTPYLNKFVKSRRLYVINQRNKLVPEKNIIKRIKQQYVEKKFIKPDGSIDVWAMLRDIRKKAIDSGEYHIPKKKGSHHPVKGDSSYRRYKDQAQEQKRKLSNARQQAPKIYDNDYWIKYWQDIRNKAVSNNDQEQIKLADDALRKLR